MASGGTIESCPDPSIIHGQKPGDNSWYLYCTNDPFFDGGPLHLMAISRSDDLVNWTYVGDVFSARPSWLASDGGLWAPDIQFFNSKYYLYYSVSKTTLASASSAIFVATADTPTGPWTASGQPVVDSAVAPCCPGALRWTIDPNIVEDNGKRYIFFGSFGGGLSARLLSADGLSSDPATEVQIASADRYEATYVVKHGGYFYLMASASDCCRGPLTGYAVFSGRSLNVLGPYLDSDGNSLLEARVGGTPVVEMNGNRWLGPGHNSVFTDAAGQDWMVYHAVDANKPYFPGGETRRPVLMDPLDWINGWPQVRAGAGPSESAQPAPVSVTGQASKYVATVAPLDQPATLIAAASDEFTSFSAQWTWVRRPPVVTIFNGVLRLDTQAGDLYLDSNSASVMMEPVPTSDYIVEVKVSTSVPLTGSYSYPQGGLVIYKDDDNYVKLVTVSINNTRQIEFAKELSPVPAGYPRYGTSVGASSGDTTYLRIAKRSSTNGDETYTAYSSHDGVTWQRGSTWRHALGTGAKIGLVSMSGAGFSTYFDYVHVYTLGN